MQSIKKKFFLKKNLNSKTHIMQYESLWTWKQQSLFDWLQVDENGSFSAITFYKTQVEKVCLNFSRLQH